MINSRAQTQPISSRKSSTHSDKSRVSLRIFLHQVEMLQHGEIRRSSNVMRLIYQNQLKFGRIILQQPLSRCDALHACNGDFGDASRVLVRHLDVDSLVRIQLSDMTGSLLYKLATVREDKGLSCFWRWWRYAIDEMAEDDGFATTGCEGEA